MSPSKNPKDYSLNKVLRHLYYDSGQERSSNMFIELTGYMQIDTSVIALFRITWDAPVIIELQRFFRLRELVPLIAILKNVHNGLPRALLLVSQMLFN